MQVCADGGGGAEGGGGDGAVLFADALVLCRPECFRATEAGKGGEGKMERARDRYAR